jgi:type VI secretion system Hcp family effector
MDVSSAVRHEIGSDKHSMIRISDSTEEKSMPHQFYMTMTGTKQGQIKATGFGGNHWHSSVGTLAPAISFEYAAEAPVDVKAGRPTGARQHGPSGSSGPTTPPKVPFKFPFTASDIQPIKPPAPTSGGTTKIPVISFESVEYACQSPVDEAIGKPKGARQHGALMIIKQIDSSSPQLLQAHYTGEVLSEVVLVAHLGGATVRKVTLQNAVITRLNRRLEFPPGITNHPAQGYHTLELSYEGIRES